MTEVINVEEVIIEVINAAEVTEVIEEAEEEEEERMTIDHQENGYLKKI